MSSEPGRVSRRLSGIDARCVVSRATNIPFSRLHDDLLAMDERAGYCYALNASAAKIWDLILTPASVGSICGALCKQFAVDAEICLQEVSELLCAMQDAGLIKVTDATMD